MAQPHITPDEMERRHVARADAVSGSTLSFLDQRLAGHEREVIDIIGLGVNQNPAPDAVPPAIAAPAHGFFVALNRAAPGHGGALHTHETEEVFVPIRGRWAVYWLAGEDEHELELGPGDVISVPIGIYRGFRCVGGDDDPLLLAIVGGPDPGRVSFHPDVVQRARDTGLAIDDDGSLREIPDSG